MKNIHILPTDKPSRLYEFGGQIMLTNELTDAFRNQHIYITSDEEIKEGDWIFNEEREPCIIRCIGKGSLRGWKKITLTTDQDLIKNGVQAIDDEFLEWYVNNPSCESIEVALVPINEFGSEITIKGYGFNKFKYKIIIPKEEPKQEYQSECICDTECREFVNVKCKVAKQETLEDITLEKVFGSEYCQFSVVENKLAILYRNQEQLLKAIKLLNNNH